MRVFSYPRLFGLLFLSVLILLLINLGFVLAHVRWGRLTDAFVAGLLPACALVIALRHRPRARRWLLFVALGTLSAAAAQLLSVLPLAFGSRSHLFSLELLAALLYALVATALFWLLVRRFWFPALDLGDFGWTLATAFLAATACRLMTQLAMHPLLYAVASLLSNYVWWFALAVSLFYSEERRKA